MKRRTSSPQTGRSISAVDPSESFAGCAKWPESGQMWIVLDWTGDISSCRGAPTNAA